MVCVASGEIGGCGDRGGIASGASLGKLISCFTHVILLLEIKIHVRHFTEQVMKLETDFEVSVMFLVPLFPLVCFFLVLFLLCSNFDRMVLLLFGMLNAHIFAPGNIGLMKLLKLSRVFNAVVCLQ